MPAKRIDQQHSATAMTAAGFRAVANLEYPGSQCGTDHLAWQFLSGFEKFLLKFHSIRRLGIKRHNRFTPGGFAYVLARTAFFDQILVEAVNGGATQIVLLGAGYDTRGFRYRELCSHCRVIELDSKPTQTRKKQCLARAGIEIPDNLVFSSIDFSSESLSDNLAAAGFDPAEKTVYLWEGVSMYLQKAAVATLLRFVSSSQHRESLIAFDYIDNIGAEDIPNHFGVEVWRETWRRFRQAEPFLFSQAQSGMEAFLRDSGLCLQQHWGSADIERDFLHSSGVDDLGQVAGWFRFVTASPS